MPEVNPIGHLIPLELLKALEAVYPLQLPSIHDSDRQIWHKVGQRSVVEFLRIKYEEANNDPLSKELLTR